MGRKKSDVDLSAKLTVEEAIHEMAHPGVQVPKGASNLELLWHKVEPFLLMLGNLFGKRVMVWVQAFADAIDEIIAGQNGDALEEPAGE